MRAIIAVWAWALVAGGVSAQQAETARSAPCSSPAYAQFDFWVGDWDVSSQDGKAAGTNAISKEERGCLIVERWTSADGSTGQSYNFYDPETMQWRQVWVSPGVVIDYAGGLTDEGAMKLVGRISYRDGRSAPFTGTWTPNADGTVTQYFEEFDRASQEWKDWFTGTYRKRAS